MNFIIIDFQLVEIGIMKVIIVWIIKMVEYLFQIKKDVNSNMFNQKQNLFLVIVNAYLMTKTVIQIKVE